MSLKNKLIELRDGFLSLIDIGSRDYQFNCDFDSHSISNHNI